MTREYVVLFAGPMAAGKTTAIAALSEIPVVSTDVANTDTQRSDKPTTTVAMDFGEITLVDGDKVRLYGVPGQKRFEFMWRILEKRALGLVLLIDAAASAPLADLADYLDAFSTFVQRGTIVVGVTRGDLAGAMSLEPLHAALRRTGRVLPLFALDAREPAQVLALLGTLLAIVDADVAAAEGFE
jgi:uncharacterized protein